MTSRFEAYLHKVAPQPRLPLFHSTSARHFRDIAAAGKLTPTACTVFVGESLLYLFYGKPAYRVSDKFGVHTGKSLLPVCFVLSPDAVATAKRIFPFDSGAFKTGHFGEHYPGLEIDDFHLGTTLDAAARLVTAFFGSNENYYHGTALNSVVVDPLNDLELQAYHEHARATGALAYDERRCTIEIQTNSEIVLHTNTKALVLPTRFLDADAVKAFLKTSGADALTYDTFEATRPSDYTAVVRQKVLDYLRKEGQV